MGSITVERALIILKHIATSSKGVGVREVAQLLGYSPAVVQKILQALVSQDFAQKDDTTRKYALGPAAIQVGFAGLTKIELRSEARSHLQTLSAESGETALLGIRIADKVMYIEKASSPAEIRMDPPIGAFRPFNCTAVGKVILAFMPDEELELLAKQNAFVQPTSNSVTDVNKLKLEMARIRESGVAIDNEEFIQGAMCLGAPIRNHEGEVIAAVAISGPTHRMTGSLQNLRAQLTDCTKKISTALGYIEKRQ